MLHLHMLFFLSCGASGQEPLRPFPNLEPGDPAPQKLYQYTGKGTTTFMSVDEIGDFLKWKAAVSGRKAALQQERSAYLTERYDWNAVRTDAACLMSGGRKRIPMGPVTRLPKGVASWEALAGLPAGEIRKRDLFPEGFKPLSHPLHSTGHMLFPESVDGCASGTPAFRHRS